MNPAFFGVADRIAGRCEDLGITREALAEALGIMPEWAEALTHDDAEFSDSLVLSQVVSLCETLKVGFPQLLAPDFASSVASSQIPRRKLRLSLRDALQNSGRTLEEVETASGWDLDQLRFESRDRHFFAHWTLDCLIDVCDAMGVHWLPIYLAATAPPTSP